MTAAVCSALRLPHSAIAVALLHGDERMNLSYFVASVLTALTPILILAAIGWFVFRAYRKGRGTGEGGRAGEGGRGKGNEPPPDEWRYRG